MTRPAFTRVNRYIFDPQAMSWSLPSGTTCPGALLCLAKADRHTGKIWNGPEQKFKCYSAVTERFPSVRQRLWANFDAVKGKSALEVADVLECMPRKTERVRIHTAGDFFSQAYFDGWLEFCRRHERVHFWAFTKSVKFWVARLGQIPSNLVLQASKGGREDHLIDEHGLKYAEVVWSEQEAAQKGLAIDVDDYLAAYGSAPFALLENFSAAKKRPAAETR
jgi:hypothetical protein